MNTSPPRLDSLAPHNHAVRYTIARMDIMRTQLHQIAHNRVLLVFLVIGATCVAFLDLRQPDMVTRSLLFKLIFTLMFDALLIGFSLTVGLIPLVMLILIRKHRGVLGEHTIELTADGLIERTDVNEALHRWTAFHKIVSTRRYLYLYVTDTLVHTVPKHCFASEDAVRAFVHEIESHTKAS